MYLKHPYRDYAAYRAYKDSYDDDYSDDDTSGDTIYGIIFIFILIIALMICFKLIFGRAIVPLITTFGTIGAIIYGYTVFKHKKQKEQAKIRQAKNKYEFDRRCFNEVIAEPKRFSTKRLKDFNNYYRTDDTNIFLCAVNFYNHNETKDTIVLNGHKYRNWLKNI